MAETHVVSALITKRSDLAAEIEHLQTQLRQKVLELDHVEATLRIFSPDIDMPDVMPRRVPTVHHAFRGEVTRIVLDALRATERPLTSVQLAEAVMRERGLDTTDKQLRRTMSRRVGACLRHWRNRGAVKSERGPGEQNMWTVVD